MDNASKAKLAVGICMAVAETIRDTSPTPTSELYVALMTKGITFETFQMLLQTLENARLIKVENHKAIWIGPNR